MSICWPDFKGACMSICRPDFKGACMSICRPDFKCSYSILRIHCPRDLYYYELPSECAVDYHRLAPLCDYRKPFLPHWAAGCDQ